MSIRCCLTMRLSDAGLHRRRTKALYPNHRFPPWPTEDATRDRSNRLLGGSSPEAAHATLARIGQGTHHLPVTSLPVKLFHHLFEPLSGLFEGDRQERHVLKSRARRRKLEFAPSRCLPLIGFFAATGVRCFQKRLEEMRAKGLDRYRRGSEHGKGGTRCLRSVHGAPRFLGTRQTDHRTVANFPDSGSGSRTLYCALNDEVERRGVAPTQTKLTLSQSSTPSLAHRRCHPRSLEPIVRRSTLHSVSAIKTVADKDHNAERES